VDLISGICLLLELFHGRQPIGDWVTWSYLPWVNLSIKREWVGWI